MGPFHDVQEALEHLVRQERLPFTSAAWSWQTEPLGRPASDPDPAALEGLVGTDVQTAALTANASGWIVRAMEPEAMVTADLRTNRVNLSYSPADGTVTRVDRG